MGMIIGVIILGFISCILASTASLFLWWKSVVSNGEIGAAPYYIQNVQTKKYLSTQPQPSVVVDQWESAAANQQWMMSYVAGKEAEGVVILMPVNREDSKVLSVSKDGKKVDLHEDDSSGRQYFKLERIGNEADKTFRLDVYSGLDNSAKPTLAASTTNNALLLSDNKPFNNKVWKFIEVTS